VELKRKKAAHQKTIKKRWLLKTAGRWPWKSESAKECVTTHLPKQLALKMDCVVASCLYSAASGKDGSLFCGREALVSRRVASVCAEASSVGSRGAADGADLGGSSKYSGEVLEDCLEKGFV